MNTNIEGLRSRRQQAQIGSEFLRQLGANFRKALKAPSERQVLQTMHLGSR